MNLTKEEVRAPLRTFVMVFLFVIGAVASSVTWGLAIKEQANNNKEDIERIEMITIPRIETNQNHCVDNIQILSDRLNKKDVEYAEIQKDLKYIIEKLDDASN